jgi:signal transduction histidine kinase
MIEATDARRDPVFAVARPQDAEPPELEDRAFLQGLVQGMRCGILTIDSERRVRLLNRVGRRVLGLPHVREGAPLEAALAAHPRVIQVLEDSFSTPILPNRAEVELGGTPGSGKTIGFTLSRVSDADGQPRGTAMFFKDLTQIEHREEQERLRDRLAELGQLAASVAHEIRNPLASIEVTCGLLRRRLGGDARAPELLDKIVAEVRRMEATVGSTLEYVRPMPLALEQVPLEPELDRAIEAVSRLESCRAVEFRRAYAAEPTVFLMDRALLRQAFENLLLNAIEAMGGRGTVRVGTEVIEAPTDASVPWIPAGARRPDSWPEASRFALVRVVDTGCGIEAEDLDQIFSPLFTTKKQGSGIGLAMVRKIVSGHRGLIDVDSRPGAGAEFTVRLPMIQLTPEARGR